MDIEIVKSSSEQLVFGLKNVDVSYANALRRIMLAEVPSMAIEYVNIEENDSPMHDEILAHRLGLIPILADPNDYEPCSGRGSLAPGKNCIELVLDFTARNDSVKSDGCVHVLTKHFRAVQHNVDGEPISPPGDDDGNFMIHQDIVIMKLKPGQRLKLRCFAVIGMGADHIKWSPVSTAAYRASPLVSIEEPVTGKDADAIASLCPKKVYDVEDGDLIVTDMGACSMCRECVRDARGKDKIKLGRVDQSFDFSVETVGAIAPQEILKRAVKVIRDKAVVVRGSLQM